MKRIKDTVLIMLVLSMIMGCTQSNDKNNEVSNDIEYFTQITKKLYPDIARQYSTTASRVEKSIRHAIKTAWNQDDGKKINDILKRRNLFKPTNSEFIALIADNLRIKKA